MCVCRVCRLQKPNNITEDDKRKHNAWFMTLNNYTDDEVKFIKTWEGLTRAHVGYEVSESGTPHLQGIFVFSVQKRFSAMRKILPRAHWEAAVDIDYCFMYCAKEFNECWHVDNRKQGERKDLAKAVYAAIESNLDLRDFVKSHNPSKQQFDHFIKAKLLLGPCSVRRPVLFDPVNNRSTLRFLWCWGPTGCGKSSGVYREFPGLYPLATYKWWDGYAGEDVVLVDDFRPDWCKFQELLTLTDIYPIRNEVKGATIWAQFTTIVFTSPEHPIDMFAPRIAEDVGQLERRITEIRQYKADGTYIVETKDNRQHRVDEVRHGRAAGKYTFTVDSRRL